MTDSLYAPYLQNSNVPYSFVTEQVTQWIHSSAMLLCVKRYLRETKLETHLVFKGQGLSNVSREPIYDDTISIWDLHDLLLDLSYCCLLENSEGNMINNYHHMIPRFVCKCQYSSKQDFCWLITNNYHISRGFIGFMINTNNSIISQMLECLLHYFSHKL